LKEEFDEDVYWPRDLLPKSITDARILVYGYDSKVSHFFEGAANQNSFLGHARTLIHDLVAVRAESVCLHYNSELVRLQVDVFVAAY